MSNTIAGCMEVYEAARRSDKLYFIAENTIFRPLFCEWEKILRAGQLGEIIYAEADYIHPIPELLRNKKTGERYWRADRPPIHYCSHSLGPILYFTGDRVVRAMGIGESERILPGVGVGAIDIQLGVFETARGLIIKLTRTQVAPRHAPIHYYHLQGTKGFIETDRRGEDRVENVQRGLVYLADEMEHTEVVTWPEHDPEAPDWATLGGHGTSDYGTFMAFLAALESGQKPTLDEVFAWNITVPGLIAAESAAQGSEWLEVPAAPAKVLTAAS
jgi:predicted dehydrogenase